MQEETNTLSLSYILVFKLYRQIDCCIETEILRLYLVIIFKFQRKWNG